MADETRGRVSITIEGIETYLEPSLEAAIEISSIAGGVTAAVQRCQALDFATIVKVIGSGLIDPKSGKRVSPVVQQKELPKAVYESGIVLMSAKAIEFCRVIITGPNADDDDADEQGEGGEEDSPLG